MQKDFETEYRELMQQNIPDLWNKIETALPLKTVEEKKISLPFKRYSVLAAACLCIIVIIPFLRMDKGKSLSAGETVAEIRMAEAADTVVQREEAIPEEAAPTGKTVLQNKKSAIAPMAENVVTIQAVIKEKVEDGSGYVIEIVEVTDAAEESILRQKTGEQIMVSAGSTEELLEIGKGYTIKIQQTTQNETEEMPAFQILEIME